MSGRARARARALVHNQVAAKQYNEMIYLPPNGVNVHYAKTRRMARLRQHGLAHPRTYITHQEYQLLLSQLIFCEWTDERNVTRYYGFEENDAYDIIENRDTKDMQAGDPALIVPLSQSRDHKGGFYEKLSDARKRFLKARASHRNREKSGDTMAAFLVFFASVARHDDPVAAETLSPIECIARAALVAHEHDEEKRRKAMELLAKQSGEISRSVTTVMSEMVCDAAVLILVFGKEAYDFISYGLARVLGTFMGSVLREMFGSNWLACWVYVIIDIAIVLVTMLVPFLLASFPVAIGAVVASSAVSEAKTKCAGSTATRWTQWLIGALGNQMVRIVTNVLGAVDFKNDMNTTVTAAIKTVPNVLGDIVIGSVFQAIDEKIIARYLNKKLPSFVACLIRACIHFTIATLIEQKSAHYGKSYLRMIVPKWINIAAIAVGNSKAERQAKLMETAKEAEGKQEQLREAEKELTSKKKSLENAREQMESARAEFKEKQKDVDDIENEINFFENVPEVKRAGPTMKELQENLKRASDNRDTAQGKMNAAESSVNEYTGFVDEAKQKVRALSEEVHKAQDAKQYQELRKKATEEAEKAAADVKLKTTKVKEETSKLATELAKNKDKQDLEKIKGLTKEVAQAERNLAEARDKLDKADVGDSFVEAAKRRERDLGAATTKREYAEGIREGIRNNRKPISVLDQTPSSTQSQKPSPVQGTNKVGTPTQKPNKASKPTQQPSPGSAPTQWPSPTQSTQPVTSSEPTLPEPEQAARQAAKLENEAAEIEREYNVNPSWSSQIFGWLAKHWKSNDSNAEQTASKTGMGSYV